MCKPQNRIVKQAPVMASNNINLSSASNTIAQPTPRWAAEKMFSKLFLPAELKIKILDYVYPKEDEPAQSDEPNTTTESTVSACTPPKLGTCPFMELPTELRRAVFAESLLAKDVLIQPLCAGEAHYESEMVRKKDTERWPKRNKTSSLMILNKPIRDEIAEVVYEERTFVIHVHEGLHDGGLEFIDAGRQPLHLQTDTSDDRFKKFSDSEKDFGFCRLKKICIQIYPSPEKNARHCAMNTYYINLALVRLLEKGRTANHRITSLKIQFMDSKRNGSEQRRRAIQRAEHYWWDPEKDQPRETSIYGVPDVKLVLLPFHYLTGCHSVSVELPSQLANHAHIASFVSQLKASMTSPLGLDFADDDLDLKIQAARQAMEDYTFSLKFGTKHHEVVDLTETDVDEDEHDHGAGEPLKKKPKTSAFHNSAFSSEVISIDDDEDEDMARALAASEEQMDIDEALRASKVSGAVDPRSLHATPPLGLT